jgi:hypothetical protein
MSLLASGLCVHERMSPCNAGSQMMQCECWPLNCRIACRCYTESRIEVSSILTLETHIPASLVKTGELKTTYGILHVTQRPHCIDMIAITRYGDGQESEESDPQVYLAGLKVYPIPVYSSLHRPLDGCQFYIIILVILSEMIFPPAKGGS